MSLTYGEKQQYPHKQLALHSLHIAVIAPGEQLVSKLLASPQCYWLSGTLSGFSPTLHTASRVSMEVSPGWMMARTGRSLGRHTQEGFRHSGVQISLSGWSWGTLFTELPLSLCRDTKQKGICSG